MKFAYRWRQTNSSSVGSLWRTVGSTRAHSVLNVHRLGVGYESAITVHSLTDTHEGCFVGMPNL